VIREVLAERAWQDLKWGGPAHDDTHTVQEFVGFIHEHAEKAIAPGTSADDTCRRLIEVAALGVAAVESIRRRYRQRGVALEPSDAGSPTCKPARNSAPAGDAVRQHCAQPESQHEAITSSDDHEDYMPHAFEPRADAAVDDDGPIWCTVCEYHRDFEIHHRSRLVLIPAHGEGEIDGK